MEEESAAAVCEDENDGGVVLACGLAVANM